MLKLFLWLRYLRKLKIVFLSIAAIALSVSLLIVVSSLFSGFIRTFEAAAVEAMGDVVIVTPVGIPKYDTFIARLEQTSIVKAATPMVSGYGLLHIGEGNVRAVDIWGIEPDSRARVTGFNRYLLKDNKTQDANSHSEVWKSGVGFVGIGLVCKPDEKTDIYDHQAALKMLGQKIHLTTGSVSSASRAGNRMEIKRKFITFSIEDIVETGVYQFDSGCVYLPIEQLSQILYPDQNSPVADQIQIKLADNVDIELAPAQIRNVWRTFVVEELNSDTDLLNHTNIETARQLLSRSIAEFRKQMGVLMVIFGAVSFGVVLLVFCIFYMIVRIKQKDIAILKSCGSSGCSVAAIFVGFGAFIGLIGSGAGMVIGYLITRNINIIEQWIRLIFGLKLWRGSVYLFSRIPNQVDWQWAVIVAALAIVAAAVGALIPAVVAALTRPVEILRYE
jgi:lipoprotein-releasing system permease protein